MIHSSSQTTVTDSTDTPIIKYDLENPDLVRTELGFGKDQRSPLTPSSSFSTEAGQESSLAKIISSPVEKPYVSAAQEVVKDHVTGVVETFDEISVKCELNVNEKTISIQLPRTLFPENIDYGLPINLKMIDEGGIRRPLVTLRTIDEKSNAEVSKEFNSILDAL